MKKIGLFILSLFALILAGNFTQAKDYEYTNLYISANILDDGTINVMENYTANFFVNKHGIIRDIPLNYSVGGKDFHIYIGNINVNGKTFTTNKDNGNIEIKIGDANRTVIGEQNYPISYSVYGLIRNFSGMGYAELYWNLVGYDFDTNINKVRAELILPKIYTGFTKDDFLITTDGKSKTIDGFEGTVDWSKGDRIIITYDKGLSAFQGITLAIKFPNNYFEFDHERQAKLIKNVGSGNTLNSVGNFISLIFGFLLIILTVSIIFLSKDITKSTTNKIDTKSGALKGDFADKFPVIVQYEPPKGINSAEAGLLLHREADAKDMLSLMYKRAAEGLINISIEKTEGSIFSSAKDIIIITKNIEISEEAPEYEKDFFKSLVCNEKNQIEKTTNLYSKLRASALENYGKNKGWFENTKNKYSLIIFFLIGAWILIKLVGDISPLLGIILLFICIPFLKGYKKLEETEEGAKLISHILGYREFLAMCDENKLRSFLQQDPLYFDKILPYAVAFGLETELIKKIEPIMKEMNIKSTWYDGDLNSMFLMNDIISSSAKHSISHYSSDSGRDSGSSFDSGGSSFSSGGGGGGGGGSSW